MIAAATPPTLPAFRNPDGKTVRVYCKHCRVDHIHGAAGILDRTNPHRVAHCVDERSPYKATGYLLQVPS